jgi:hypothetical protein
MFLVTILIVRFWWLRRARIRVTPAIVHCRRMASVCNPPGKRAALKASEIALGVPGPEVRPVAYTLGLHQIHELCGGLGKRCHFVSSCRANPDDVNTLIGDMSPVNTHQQNIYCAPRHGCTVLGW